MFNLFIFLRCSAEIVLYIRSFCHSSPSVQNHLPAIVKLLFIYFFLNNMNFTMNILTIAIVVYSHFLRSNQCAKGRIEKKNFFFLVFCNEIKEIGFSVLRLSTSTCCEEYFGCLTENHAIWSIHNPHRMIMYHTIQKEDSVSFCDIKNYFRQECGAQIAIFCCWSFKSLSPNLLMTFENYSTLTY